MQVNLFAQLQEEQGDLWKKASWHWAAISFSRNTDTFFLVPVQSEAMFLSRPADAFESMCCFKRCIAAFQSHKAQNSFF